MKYLLIMNVDPAIMDNLPEAESQALMTGHGAFMEKIKETGEMISTYALGDHAQTSVVRVKDDAVSITDGPFLDSKAFMGGYYLVDCETKERAQELAALIPDAKIEGFGIEVRPVMFSAGAGT
jgi:hypothetical protein